MTEATRTASLPTQAPQTTLRGVKLHRLGRHQEHAIYILFARMCNFEQSCHEVQVVPSKYVDGVAVCWNLDATGESDR